MTRTYPYVFSLAAQDVHEMMSNYSTWLSEDGSVPKLYIHAEPGTLSGWIQRTVSGWPNLRTVTAKGRHYVHEDDPDTIGKHVVEFLKEIYKS